MHPYFRAVLLAFWGAFLSATSAADESTDGIRVLSWNVSDNAFVVRPADFKALVAWADPDVVLLDEVSPSADPGALEKSLAALESRDNGSWRINVGVSGGRQRGLIATRGSLETLPEFESIIAYPEADRQRILDAMSAKARANPDWSMDGGIPINGAVLGVGGRRLLVVIADLQCCGDGPDSWQEFRRRVEAREIRRLITQILDKHDVDGVILAGDFNMVNSTFPMALLAGPLPAPHFGLVAAEAYHPDGESTWTWDGRRTPFPSNVLDYQFYGPRGLEHLAGHVLDAESASGDVLEQFGLARDSTVRTGRHRPVLVRYRWNPQAGR